MESTDALMEDALRRANRYRNERAVSVSPTEQALAALDRLPDRLPDLGVPAEQVIALLDDLGSPATVRSTGGRYFGFVNGGTEPAGAAASILSTAWDQNAALPVMSPIAAHLDGIAARWVTELLHLPESSTASFCGGASIANLTCVIAARDALLHRAGWNIEKRGLVGAPAIRVVVSAESHASVFKALRGAGFGSDSFITVPTDDRGRMKADEMPDTDELTLVMMQAGNVNTGHSDPFRSIISETRPTGAWVHVDGAFGLWAAASPRLAPLVDGVDLADSWATDAHKWLNAPYDSGIAVCARGEDLRRAMSVDAAYLPNDAARAPMHLSLQMSQKARAVETWAILLAQGRSGLVDSLERACDHAQHLADLLADAGVEILAPVVLNQALAAFGDAQQTDRVIAAVQEDRTCWAGGTLWQGRRAMRLSVSDNSTTRADIEASAEAIIQVARQS